MATEEDPSEEGSGSSGSGTSEAPAAAEASTPVLPDDVIFAILVLVPDLVSLFRCSVVCKPWRRMLTSPAFLSSRTWPEGSRPSLLGFFAQRHRIGGGSSRRRKISRLFPTRAPAFIPSPGSHLGPERRFLTSFFRDDAGVLDDAKPLAARGGLLLVLVRAPPSSSSSRGRNGGSNRLLCLCVCNMFTGRHDLLPPLDAGFLDGDGVKGYALLTAADHGAAAAPHRPTEGYSTFFQVLLIGVAREERQLHLIRFSSAAAAGDSGIWCFHNCSQLTGVPLRGPYGCCIAAVARGTAHWLFRGNNDPGMPRLYTLDVSISTWNISATLLPFDALPMIFRQDLSNAWLSTSLDPRLVLVYVKNNNLTIWAQRNGDQQVGNVGWGLAHVVHIDDDVEPGLFGTESLTPVCIGENSGTVLALYHSNPECAYVINLKSGSATKLEGWTRSFNYMTAVPYEINWPLFFMSRLGLRPYMLGAA